MKDKDRNFRATALQTADSPRMPRAAPMAARSFSFSRRPPCPATPGLQHAIPHSAGPRALNRNRSLTLLVLVLVQLTWIHAPSSPASAYVTQLAPPTRNTLHAPVTSNKLVPSVSGLVALPCGDSSLPLCLGPPSTLPTQLPHKPARPELDLVGLCTRISDPHSDYRTL